MSAAHLALILGLTLPTAPPVAVKVPEYEQFVIVPLRVHVLNAANLELVNTTLSDAEITRVIGDLNAIWHKAGIHLALESIVREPAAHQERLRLIARLRRNQFSVNLIPMLLPRGSRVAEGLDVYFFRDLPLNGVYFADDSIVVQEQPQLQPVQAGSGDPIARVLGHSVGYALGLPDRPEPENLMSQATTGVALNAEQVDAARRIARTLRGAAAVADARKAAEAAESRGDRDAALRLWSWLAEVPGDGSAAAKRRWAALHNP